jgi:hypothetical protein
LCLCDWSHHNSIVSMSNITCKIIMYNEFNVPPTYKGRVTTAINGR